jgi:hypothetical protein
MSSKKSCGDIADEYDDVASQHIIKRDDGSFLVDGVTNQTKWCNAPNYWSKTPIKPVLTRWLGMY